MTKVEIILCIAGGILLIVGFAVPNPWVLLISGGSGFVLIAIALVISVVNRGKSGNDWLD